MTLFTKVQQNPTVFNLLDPKSRLREVANYENKFLYLYVAYYLPYCSEGLIEITKLHSISPNKLFYAHNQELNIYRHI